MMNVSLMAASSYAAIDSISKASTYKAQNAANNSSTSTTSAGPDVVVTFSEKALELLRLRNVSDKTTQQFQDILARAKTKNGSASPKDFLNTLSSSDMEVLRMVHSLADPIKISSLTNEGAANLLVQPGSARDLDNNGLTSIGAGNLLTFPPENAPASFKAAWASATEGMSFGDIPTQMIFAVGLANIHYDPATGQVTTVGPDDPNWRNPYADPNFDYKGAVSDAIDALNFTYQHGGMSKNKYQQDIAFYSRLSDAMG
jgi:hypothetical protein